MLLPCINTKNRLGIFKWDVIYLLYLGVSIMKLFITVDESYELYKLICSRYIHCHLATGVIPFGTRAGGREVRG